VHAFSNGMMPSMQINPMNNVFGNNKKRKKVWGAERNI